jgi:hypothetical protein
MGFTVNTIGGLPVDRSAARLTLYTESDDPNTWRLQIHFQDAIYDQTGKRLEEPKFGTEEVNYRYADIKDLPLTNGGKVSDLFGPIHDLCYTLRQKHADAVAAGTAGPQPIAQP